MDHQDTANRYRYPPRKSDSEIIDLFSEQLNELIPIKLKDLMDRQDVVLADYERAKKVIDKELKEKDEGTKYFWNLWNELQFIEYSMITKWLKYYLRLAEQATPDAHWISQARTEHGLSDMEIGRIKEHPIEDLYEGKLRVNGRRLIGSCPFHKEKTPSFVIFTENNRFYCFGCHKHGDVIDFYMMKNSIENFGTELRALL